MYVPARSDGRTQRTGPRLAVRLTAKLRQSGAKPLDTEIHDLSTHGFQIDTVHVLRPDAMVWVQFAGLAPLPARVRWFRDYRVGCAFEQPLHPAVFDRILATASA